MSGALIKETPEEELRDWLTRMGEPNYRLGQIREWLYKHYARDFSSMTTLPAELRQSLGRQWRAFALECLEQRRSSDGTVKYLFELKDGERVETVLLRAGRRTTVCVSVQVGCPVGCVFCATGRSGYVRDLSWSEIVDQVLYTCGELGERVRNVVVMGMGEPLLNLDALIPALEALCASDGVGVGDRHVTVSTSGIAPGIRRLADCGRQWGLAVSLHAGADALRRRLIPKRFRYPLHEIMDACRFYRDRTGRMVTFEYVLLRGVNMSRGELRALAALARDVHAKINLIPWNRAGTGFHRPTREEVRMAERFLREQGVSATVRVSRGQDIAGACGQLRAARTRVGGRRGRGGSEQAGPVQRGSARK